MASKKETTSVKRDTTNRILTLEQGIKAGEKALGELTVKLREVEATYEVERCRLKVPKL